MLLAREEDYAEFRKGVEGTEDFIRVVFPGWASRRGVGLRRVSLRRIFIAY